MEMTAAEWVSALGQTALVIAISFVVLCLITSIVRFQMMTESVQESKELGLGEDKAFRLVIMNRIAAARRAREPITVLLLRVPPDGAPRDDVEAHLTRHLRRDDQVMACGPDLIGILLLCGSDRADRVAGRVTSPEVAAGLAGVDRWRFGVAGYPEHGFKTSEIYPRALEMLAKAEQEGLLVAGMESAEAVAEEKSAPAGIIDEHTGLVREDKMINTMRRYVANARRADKPATVVYIEIDQFNRVAETLRENMAAALIKEVAEFLDEQFREKDLLCRFGAAGFVVSLVAGPGEVMPVVQRVAAAVRRHVFKAGQATKITVSAGLAGFPDVQGTAVQYFLAAEMALQQARSRGRNQLVRYEPSMPLPAAQPEKNVDRL